METISCSKTNDLPKCFSINHSNEGQAEHISNENTCSSLTYSCCKRSELSDLNHYWQAQNSENNFSRDAREMAQFYLDIFINYQEIWYQRAIDIKEKSSIDKQATEDVKYILTQFDPKNR